ncbi:DUF2254 domain-containing protein [Aurantimonas sp. DM33-3]|uniref:DUF2254 family protein n=1 Tax=Aurantimonas sp. DM33-3 TaxID=2766955 RepID=UPI00165255FF|nr:DUF2254 family protein [Aurantimonas sp. DM33-3]MBC6718380.1 DUF2254 domain-containing protein [Aurantimonas sp. DM33-3]
MAGPNSPLRWFASLLWHSFWGLPVLMIAAAIGIAFTLLLLDAGGASAWIGSFGYPFALSGGTARELANTFAAVHATFVSLYFSITLLVLTLAAGNLGVRLIDRWIGHGRVRFTIGLLLGSLAWALIALAAVNAGDGEDGYARLTLFTLLVVTLFVISWLAFALHDLGRIIHVDTDITALRMDAVADATPLRRLAATAPTIGWTAGRGLAAPRDGYVETIDRLALADRMGEAGGHLKLVVSVGDYVMRGEPLALLASDPLDDGQATALTRAFGIGRFRSGAQGAPFHVNLLVEIAGRALSPAVNDFYTAFACIDGLGPILVAQGNLPQHPQWVADAVGNARVLAVEDPFIRLFRTPLDALRNAAAPNPQVAIRLIAMLRRAIGMIGDAGIRQFLEDQARVLADQASTKAQADRDRAAIAAAWDGTAVPYDG